MNAELRTVIESETHRRGATRRTSGVWRQSPLATASWSDWALRDEDDRHPTPVDAARQLGDNRHVSPLRKTAAVRPTLLIRRRYRAGVGVAAIAVEVGLPESVVRAVLDSPLTQALAVLEDDDGNA